VSVQLSVCAVISIAKVESHNAFDTNIGQRRRYRTHNNGRHRFFPALAATRDVSALGSAVSPAEAHTFGVVTYLYSYSPITMDVTRKQSINIDTEKMFGLEHARCHFGAELT